MEQLNIWGATVPYNKPDVKKRKLMAVKPLPLLISMPQFLLHVFGSKVAKNAAGLDTYAYRKEVGKGTVSKYLNDVPTVQPYLVESADTAVIVAPGGAFCYLERENEGKNIAEALNAAGISAFVLEYRLNPYEAPACYLDMQRAIRYVRFHAKEYGLDPQKIGTLGFSAGGYVAGASNIFLGDLPVECSGYTPDEIDAVDGTPSFTGMIYPVFSFDVNPNMLAVLAGDAFFDETKRKDLQAQYSLPKHIDGISAPIFFAYGNKDFLKGQKEMVEALEQNGNGNKVLLVEGAAHGFSLNKKYSYWFDEWIQWIHQTTN